MSSEYAGTIRDRRARPRRGTRRSNPRALAIQLLGPLTILAGVVWGIAQPYRILLEREGRSVYDLIIQPPLLVIAVGLLYAVFVAPGLVADLEQEDDGPSG